MAYPDFYQVLGLEHNASIADVKRAYQAALLAAHPDKRRLHANPTWTIDDIREAFAVLGDPKKRADYDSGRSRLGNQSGPRPAHVLSLDDFVEHRDRWTYACRCGGTFAIVEAQMEAETHLIGCDSCSETVWVGYELN